MAIIYPPGYQPPGSQTRGAMDNIAQTNIAIGEARRRREERLQNSIAGGIESIGAGFGQGIADRARFDQREELDKRKVSQRFTDRLVEAGLFEYDYSPEQKQELTAIAAQMQEIQSSTKYRPEEKQHFLEQAQARQTTIMSAPVVRPKAQKPTNPMEIIAKQVVPINEGAFKSGFFSIDPKTGKVDVVEPPKPQKEIEYDEAYKQVQMLKTTRGDADPTPTRDEIVSAMKLKQEVMAEFKGSAQEQPEQKPTGAQPNLPAGPKAASEPRVDNLRPIEYKAGMPVTPGASYIMMFAPKGQKPKRVQVVIRPDGKPEIVREFE